MRNSLKICVNATTTLCKPSYKINIMCRAPQEDYEFVSIDPE